jgi:hypothetical protein
MNHSFHTLADKEVDEIVEYYDGVEETLGDEFFSELQNAITPSLTASQRLAESMAVCSSLSLESLSLPIGLPGKA